MIHQGLMADARVQEEVADMLAACDKSLHGAETGTLRKEDVADTLEAFFRVGQRGGKTPDRFDELMQARAQRSCGRKAVELASECVMIGFRQQCY